MSEWKDYKLGDIAEIIMGQSPSGETCNSFGEGIPLLNGPTEFSVMHPYPVQFTSDAKRLSKAGDILFCVRGSTTGKMNWSNIEYAIGRGVAAIRHKFNQRAQYFIKGILDYHLPIILGGATGSTFPNVSGEDLRNLIISAPSETTQTAIAEILSSLDDKIDLLHRQNLTLEQLAETLFRKWFVEEAEEWNGTLAEYVKVQGGFAFKSQDFKQNGFAGIVKIKNISMGSIDIVNTDFVNEEIVKNIDKRFKIKSGDFLIAMTGAEIGKIGIVENTDKEIWVNQRVGKLEARVSYGDLVGYIALKSINGQEHIINTCAGSAQENISSSGIEEMIFASYDEVKTKEFGEKVSPFFEKIKSNSQQIRTLTRLRDTLLPKLMSGEIRLNH